MLPAGPRVHRRRPLLEALRAKAPFASYMTTQLCFDPGAIATWIAARRAEGIDAAGPDRRAGRRRARTSCSRSAPGSASRTRTGSCVKNLRFVAGLVRSGGFYGRPGSSRASRRYIADPAAGVVGLHMYTFNAVEATEAWRQSMLEKLDH